MSLVVIRNNKLGDSLCTTPLLTALSEQSIAEKIFVFGPVAFSTVFEYHPGVDEFHPFTEPQSLIDAIRLGRSIRRLKPSKILLTRANGRLVAIAALLSGASVRVGMVSRRKWYSKLLTMNCAELDEQRHHTAERFLKLGDALASRTLRRAPMRYEPPDSALILAKQNLKQMGAVDQAIVLHVGGGGANRALTTDKYIEVAKSLTDSFQSPLLLTGDRDCHSVGDVIAAATSAGALVLNLIGKTDLTELALLFKDASVVVGVDTGAIHLAAAVGTPIVDIMPKISIDPEEWFPWQAKGTYVLPMKFCDGCSRVSCTIAASTCIDTISVAEVMRRTADVLGCTDPNLAAQKVKPEVLVSETLNP